MTLDRKQSEKELGEAFRSAGFQVQKQRDRGYANCPQCHRPITKCPNCNGHALLEKAKTLPDFLIAPFHIFVECKQGHDSWPITDFSTIQVERLNEQARIGEMAYFFLLMGDGKVTTGGRRAWLVHWPDWVQVQQELLKGGIKSLRFEDSTRSRMPTAGYILEGWELEWKNGAWRIPANHVFWKDYRDRLERTIGGNS